jgi:arylsulfatase A-like enzyme
LLEALGELEIAELRSAYQNAALEVLAELGRLIDGVEERGGLNDTLVVIAGSSGFELGEHGGAGNGWTTYQESIHVPLLFLWRAGLPAGDSVSVVSLVDVMPTLLQVASAAAEEGELDGSALLETSGEGWRLAPVSGPRIAELVVRERAIARAVVDGDFAFVVTQRFVPPADRPVVARGIEEIQAAMLAGSHQTPPLWGEASSQELFDLAADPWQQSPILDQASDPLAVLRGALRSYRRACEESAFEPLEITRRLEIDPEQLKQLESLGYL